MSGNVPEDFSARIDRLDQLTLKLYHEACLWRPRLSPIMVALKAKSQQRQGRKEKAP
jgi:hypothetical protein